MDPDEMDKLINALARPMFVYRMNYMKQNLPGNRGLGARVLVGEARQEIDDLVRDYADGHLEV